jgi:HEAT repeat protein
MRRKMKKGRKKNRNTEPTMPSNIENIITELNKSDKSIQNSRLAELSNLNLEEQKFFIHFWQKIEPALRRHIIHRLVEMAEDNLELNFDSIYKFCLTDQDDEVRCSAIEGLWENEEASLLDPLINLLEQDVSDKVQAAAARALGKFAILAECKKLRPSHMSRIQKVLLAVIRDKNRPAEVRRRALESVAPISLPVVKTAIMEAYKSPNSRLKISSIYAMGKSCDPSWLPILLKEMVNDDAEVRYEAAGACGELEEETAVPGLIKLINDDDTDVQMAAIQALGKIGNTQAKECLKQCLESFSEAIRQTAEEALNELEAMEDPFSFRS